MSNRVDKKSADEIQAALQSNNQPLAIAKIKEYLKKAEDTPLNIAITGETGSGKSSFVNGFRGIGEMDENAAPVGCLETTTQVKKYLHPGYPKVTLWDLPGIGTMKFPANEYLKKVGFEEYDFFIIISDTRFRENDVKLAKGIQKMGKKLYFVRSKIDNDLQAMKKCKMNVSEEELLGKIRRNCIEGLQDAGVTSPKVFLVSRFDLHLYDFPLLQQTLDEDLPEHKRDVLLFAMPNISREVINKKKRAFQNKIQAHALLSACGAVIPFPGASVTLDLGMMALVSRGYLLGFGLDRASLKRLSIATGIPLADLMGVLRSPLALTEITPSLILMLLLGCTTLAVLMSTEEGARYIPIFGTIVAATLSFKVTKYALQMFLDKLAEDAHRVFMKALGSDTTV